MTTLKRLKSIPNTSKHATFGYIREMEHQLALSNIPVMINYLCLGYYFHGEYFEKAGNDLSITNDKMSVTRITAPIYGARNRTTAYGKQWVELNTQKTIKWKFKIDSFGHRNSFDATIWLGIVSKDHRINEDFGNQNDHPLWYQKIKRSDGNAFTGYDSWHSHYLVEDTEYELILSGERVLFQENGHIISDELSHLRNDIRYKLALCMTVKDAKFTLIDFCIE